MDLSLLLCPRRTAQVRRTACNVRLCRALAKHHPPFARYGTGRVNCSGAPAPQLCVTSLQVRSSTSSQQHRSQSNYTAQEHPKRGG